MIKKIAKEKNSFTEDDSGSFKRNKTAQAVQNHLAKIEKYGSRLNEYINKNFGLIDLPCQSLEDLHFFQ